MYVTVNIFITNRNRRYSLKTDILHRGKSYMHIMILPSLNQHSRVLCKHGNGERASPANLKSSIGSKLICLGCHKFGLLS